jgi:DNA-binding MarR family transcriptional regulator
MGSQLKMSASKSRLGAHPRIPPPESRVVLDAIRRIFQALRVSSRAAEQRVGLSGAQLFVLSTLAGQGACSLNELAQLTATHQSSVSVVVSRLSARGLLRRTIERADKRRLRLSLTPKGRALLLEAPEAAQERLIAGLERLTDRDRSTLSRILSDLVAKAGIEREPPALFFEDPGLSAGLRKGRKS